MKDLEKAGDMLLRLGYREEVIVLLGRGWLDEKHPAFDTPEKLRAARIEEIKRLYPKLAKYF